MEFKLSDYWFDSKWLRPGQPVGDRHLSCFVRWVSGEHPYSALCGDQCCITDLSSLIPTEEVTPTGDSEDDSVVDVVSLESPPPASQIRSTLLRNSTSGKAEIKGQVIEVKSNKKTKKKPTSRI